MEDPKIGPLRPDYMHLVEPDHRCNIQRACPHEVAEILRVTAYDRLAVVSDGETIGEILEEVYRQGGIDALDSLRLIARATGADLAGAVLGVEWKKPNT